MRSGLRLEAVTEDNVRPACELKIGPDQEKFVAPVAFSPADAYTIPHIAWPRLVYDSDELVGFIMAAFGADNPSRAVPQLLVAAEHRHRAPGSRLWPVRRREPVSGGNAARVPSADGVLLPG